MSLNDDAFKYVPDLRGRILDPLTSRFRNLDYKNIDELAAEQGLGPDWRRTDAEREATRAEALAGRDGEDLWVFAYGSLMWDPGFLFEEVRLALLPDYQRCFCLMTEVGRGSPTAPGLMAALDCGGTCEGLAFRIAGERVDTETEIIWRREMIIQGYVPTFVGLDTAQGTVEGLAFVVDHSGPRYLPDHDPDDAARMIAQGVGQLGTNIEYLDNLAEQLDLLGIHDEEFHDVHRRARAVLAAAAE